MYAIKEIFHTLQGEGFHQGRSAVFVRFNGCNLWSGREEDRSQGRGGCAAWCDTDFVGHTSSGGKFDTASLVAGLVEAVWVTNCGMPGRFVVLTGGEPLLQTDDALVDALHSKGFEIAVETNGTLLAPSGIDWLTLSPKAGAKVVLTRADELKLVYPQAGCEPGAWKNFTATHFFLQPMDGPSLAESTRAAAEFCRTHPQWKLSVQMHKVVGLP